MSHLLFVCTANLCRSPMAEQLARVLLAEFPDHTAKVRLLNALAGQSFDIVDPSGEDIEAYRRVAGQIRDLLTYSLARIPTLALGGDLS